MSERVKTKLESTAGANNPYFNIAHEILADEARSTVPLNELPLPDRFSRSRKDRTPDVEGNVLLLLGTEARVRELAKVISDASPPKNRTTTVGKEFRIIAEQAKRILAIDERDECFVPSLTLVGNERREPNKQELIPVILQRIEEDKLPKISGQKRKKVNKAIDMAQRAIGQSRTDVDRLQYIHRVLAQARRGETNKERRENINGWLDSLQVRMDQMSENVPVSKYDNTDIENMHNEIGRIQQFSTDLESLSTMRVSNRKNLRKSIKDGTTIDNAIQELKKLAKSYGKLSNHMSRYYRNISAPKQSFDSAGNINGKPVVFEIYINYLGGSEIIECTGKMVGSGKSESAILVKSDNYRYRLVPDGEPEIFFDESDALIVDKNKLPLIIPRNKIKRKGHPDGVVVVSNIRAIDKIVNSAYWK